MENQKSNSHATCAICGHKKKESECKTLQSNRPGVQELILKTHPALKPAEWICNNDLRPFRVQYVESILAAEKGELTKLDHEVIKSMVDHEILTRNINTQFNRRRTLGEQIADKIAVFGGSWKFIGFFAVVLFGWIIVNSAMLFGKPFDPFPFILLNLVLSTLAAIQAPVIMMSQNRREAKDRLRAELDYKVNLKAELQIRNLSEKLDYLTQQQWQRLIEIQKMQLELLEGTKGSKK